MAYRVLLPEDMDRAGKDYLTERGYELVRCGPEPDAMSEAIAVCDALVVRNIDVPRALMERAPRLRVISRHGIGVERIDLDAAAERGIWVANGPESNTNAVAEQVVGAILALARRLPACDAMVREGRFAQRGRIQGMELRGKVLGVAGFGRIGRLVARKAALGLEMRVVTFDPWASAERDVPVRFADTLEELLEAADVVTLHMPLTPETRGRIGAAELGRMKRSAYLINYGRAGLVDTDALVRALRNEIIAGAAVDVFDEEPVAAEHPLCDLPQTLLSPHTAAFTAQSLENMSLHAAVNIHRVFSGEEPRWWVVRGKKVEAS